MEKRWRDVQNMSLDSQKLSHSFDDFFKSEKLRPAHFNTLSVFMSIVERLGKTMDHIIDIERLKCHLFSCWERNEKKLLQGVEKEIDKGISLPKNDGGSKDRIGKPTLANLLFSLPLCSMIE